MTQAIRENFSDPLCGHNSGDQTIKWCAFAASQVAGLRSGKAVDLHTRYQIATATSSNLAGFLASDAIGVTGGHPASVSDGDELPVDMGENTTFVMPTSNRRATANDIGKAYDIVVSSESVQCVNMATSAKQILTVVELIDTNGDFVSVRIPSTKRHGQLT